MLALFFSTHIRNLATCCRAWRRVRIIAPELRQNCAARHLHRREDAAEAVGDRLRGLHVVRHLLAELLHQTERGGHVLAVGADEVLLGPQSVDLLLRELEFGGEDAEEVRRQ